MDKFTITIARAILAAALVTSAGVAMAESSARSNVTNIAATARCAGGANTTTNPTNCDKPVSTNRKAGGGPQGTQVQLNPQPLPPSTGNPGERKAGGDPSSKSTAIIIEGHTTPNQTGGAVTK